MHAKNQTDLFEKIDLGLKKAVKNALLQHKQASKPIHIWVGNQVVEVMPEKISAGEDLPDSY